MREKAELQQHIRIQCEDPLAAAEGDRLVLASREPRVAVIFKQADTILLASSHLSGVVLRRVIDHNNFQRLEFLPQDRVQATTDEPAAVMCNDGHADQHRFHGSC